MKQIVTIIAFSIIFIISAILMSLTPPTPPPPSPSYRIERYYYDGHTFYVLVNSSGNPIAFKE